jgi:hypothetical protein
MTPIAQQSAGKAYPGREGARLSGEEYAHVPAVAVSFLPGPSRADRPKSASFTCCPCRPTAGAAPLSRLARDARGGGAPCVSSRFSGFRSRCMMPRACMKATASNTPRTTSRASISL